MGSATRPFTDYPAWDQFNRITTHWLLSARTPDDERAIWDMKVRAYRLYHRTHDPEGIARRLLAIVTRDRSAARAA